MSLSTDYYNIYSFYFAAFSIVFYPNISQAKVTNIFGNVTCVPCPVGTYADKSELVTCIHDLSIYVQCSKSIARKDSRCD